MTAKPSTWKRIGDALNTDDDKGVVIAVAIALIVIIGVVAGYYVYHVIYEKPEGYTNIYVLDANGTATNYTFTLIVNQETTFNVYVENHMGRVESFEVREKITNQPTPQLPADVPPETTYTKTLNDGERWAIQAPVTISGLGSCTVFFELWQQDLGVLKYTGNAAILHVDVVNQP